ncbi:MAG TPA: NUDIX domain-containing protein [Devosia sp.]|jgi:8-oxo-dGTP pyrophosphatase MutT (NUDIX family)|uniref:NUDIX hydrolase n=1 Tax=Devosia sp. TaxID=1871048 RepID=UPI002DDDAB53|nr:NUDIX domain-containing protein [Devosia sp.]HEV2515517.1 NUDIX domain-containing protein [Devosia sp.]
MTTHPRTIRIAAAVLADLDGRVLLVRKRGTAIFMQPGGKIEPGEAPLEALRREVREELGLTIDPAVAHYLGVFSAPAAHEAGATVVAEAFWLNIRSHPSPEAEIEEVRWIDPQDPGPIELAVLSRDHILPAYRRAR